MNEFKITVIGAGIVGLALAARLSKRFKSLLVLEKNEMIGIETSSRNSEVVHAGISYLPNSLKARLCVEGKNELYTLCAKYKIPCKKITKLIVSTSELEQNKLINLYENGLENGVDIQMISGMTIKKLEPNIIGFQAIFSPSTGVIDSRVLMDFFAYSTKRQGGKIKLNHSLKAITKVGNGYELLVNNQDKVCKFKSEIVINAAGLNSDLVAKVLGLDTEKLAYNLNFCKGSYFLVNQAKHKLISRLIYPLPSNESLGVHALLDLKGNFKFGPDAEYLKDRTQDYSVNENKKREFLRQIQKIVPGIREEDIKPNISGIRPKLQREGEPPKDFVIKHEKEEGFEGFVNLIGIDSPGLTASPAIARYVDDLLFH